MEDLDISQYFFEFSPSPQKLRKLKKLLKGIHKWWGIDFGDSVIEATLLLAPGELSELSCPAYNLLNRCRNRVWAFNVDINSTYDPFHKDTYKSLFINLLSLDLIVESSSQNKLKGSKNVKELRNLLSKKGLSDQGRKDDLVNRIVMNYSVEELNILISDVIHYQTTEKGERALGIISDMQPRVQEAFLAAVQATMDCFDEQPTPTFPPGVYYDDGEVIITEEDATKAEEAIISILREIKQGEGELSKEFIQILVGAIESSGDGWLSVSTTREELPRFIHASFKSSYPNKQWYLDANGDIDIISILGFFKDEDSPLPMKWVSSDRITETIIDTVERAFGLRLGTIVNINYYISKND